MRKCSHCGQEMHSPQDEGIFCNTCHKLAGPVATVTPPRDMSALLLIVILLTAAGFFAWWLWPGNFPFSK